MSKKKYERKEMGKGLESKKIPEKGRVKRIRVRNNTREMKKELD
jgi:hypothetical protein